MSTTTRLLTAFVLVAAVALTNTTTAGEVQKQSDSTVRASQIIGHNIQNSTGKDLGEVEDLVLDARTGRIRYVAVTYGGFLGLGNKLFAVPYEAFECKPNPEDREETIVVLDVTQEQLEGAKGFDEDNWPNFADKKFTDELDKRYGVERQRRSRNRERSANDEVDRNRLELEDSASSDRDDQ